MIEWRSDNNHAESIKKNSNNVNTSVIAEHIKELEACIVQV